MGERKRQYDDYVKNINAESREDALKRAVQMSRVFHNCGFGVDVTDNKDKNTITIVAEHLLGSRRINHIRWATA